MKKEKLRNQLTDERVPGPINGVIEEIIDQDLDEKAGAGLTSAIQLTLDDRCYIRYITISYDCTNNPYLC
ncbi:salivaricin M family lantibiotic [Pseudobacteroides cellulosolvens]|uniref:Uncharacterized protein n=1 Tax=Pseudobacteroides cellulosolvens ATCC 35603 = DSM 2933 TaxID=398512 RepID=A0A0L6JTE3_9FIRM|nr:salivaricin M family lantibiotic [Pseudobacteroides cellulosolvens]KNY28950.1 hypothetical protein Bccel_4224 [Pseudobacteroides cellulosolvens ATCC 35603 = DSM 2933]